MALPRTISGIDTPSDLHFSPPVRDGNGNHYVVVLDSADISIIEVWKADNGDAAWAEVDSGNHPNSASNIQSLWVYPDGTRLKIITQNVSDGVEYHEFALSDDGSADQWITTTEAVATLTESLGQSCAIAVRSDGDKAAFFSGEVERLKGTDYRRISYSIHEGTAWGDVSGTIDDGGTVDYTAVAVVMGASDKIHIFYKDDTNSDLYHKSLNSSNTLSSAEIVNDTALDVVNDNIIPGVYYDASGTERITIGWEDSSGNTVYTAEIDNDGTPGAEESASDNTVQDDLSIVPVACLAVDPATDTVYLVYANDADQDLYLDENVNSGGWGTDTEILDAVTVNRISGDNVYQIDNGDTVLAYVYDDAGTIKYNEYVLVSSGATVALNTLTLAGSIPSLTVTPGAVSSLLDTLTLAGSAQNLSAQLPTSILLDELTLVGSIPNSTVSAGAIAVLLNALTLISNAESLTVTPGAISVGLNELSLVSNAESLAVNSVVSILLNELTLAGSVENSTVVPGAIAALLNTLTLSSSAETSTVAPGAISTLLDTLTLASSAEAINVTIGAGIALNTLTLAGSIENSTVVPGAVAATLNSLTLASSAETASVQAVVSILLNTLSLAGSVESLSITLGAVSALLNTLALSSSVETSTVAPGAIAALLNTLTLASSPESLTVSVAAGGEIVSLNELTLASAVQGLSVSPGAIATLLSTLTLASSVEALTIQAAVAILLDELTLSSNVEATTVQPGAVSILLDTITLASSLEALTVVTIIAVIVADNRAFIRFRDKRVGIEFNDRRAAITFRDKRVGIEFNDGRAFIRFRDKRVGIDPGE